MHSSRIADWSPRYHHRHCYYDNPYSNVASVLGIDFDLSVFLGNVAWRALVIRALGVLLDRVS